MFKKCMKCGSVVYVIKGNGSIVCCNEEMKELVPNIVDAAFEKHVPNVEKVGDKIKVSVNHVMDEDHYIEWIAMETDDSIILKSLKPGDEAVVTFDYLSGFKVYSYCNKHGLWINNKENKEK